MPKSAVQEFDPNDLYPIPENVLVPVTLQRCEAVNVEFTYKRGPKAGTKGGFLKWEWEFMVHDGPYAGTSFRGNTEPKVTNSVETDFLPAAKPLIEALLGRQLEVGEEVDTDLYIGLKAQATVKHQEARARKDGDGYWYNVELDELFPEYGPNVTGQPSQPVGQPTMAGQWTQAGDDQPPF